MKATPLYIKDIIETSILKLKCKLVGWSVMSLACTNHKWHGKLCSN